MEAFIKDLRHSVRMFSQSPGLTIAAVAALALGIGPNSAIFSVVNTVLLKPLTYPDPDRIIQFPQVSPQGKGPAASVPKYEMWREQANLFQDVAAYDFPWPGIEFNGRRLSGTDQGFACDGGLFFRLFGAGKERGRVFSGDPLRVFAAMAGAE